MSGIVRSLTYVISGRDQLSPMLRRVGDESLTTAKRVETAGKLMTKYITLPIAAIGAISVKSASDFNSSMKKIQTQAGGSARDVEVLSKQVLNLGLYAQQGPKELSDALFHLKSVGMDNATAMKALKNAADLAALGNTDLEATTNAVAGAWRSGIKGARDFGVASATLNAIIGAGNMRMEDLVAAMGTGFLSTAATFGISLKSVGAALATLTDAGMPANAAATRLRMSISLLGAPSTKAAGELSRIGLTGKELATAMRGPGGLVAAIGLLKSHIETSGLSAVEASQLLSAAFGGGRSSAAIMALVQNFDVLSKTQDKITRGIGKYGSAVAAQRKTASAQFALLKSSIQVLGVQIGNILLPMLVKLSQVFGTFFTWLAKMPRPVQQFAMTLLLVAAAIGPILVMTAKVVMAFQTLNGVMHTLQITSRGAAILGLGIWGIIAAAVAVAVILIIKNWDKIKKATIAVWNATVRFLKAAWEGIVNAAKAVWRFFDSKWAQIGLMIINPIVGSIVLVAKHWNTIKSVILGAYNAIIGFFKRIINFVSTTFTKWWADNGEAIKRIWNRVWSALSTIFQPIWNAIVAAVRFGWSVMVVVFTTYWKIIQAVWSTGWNILKAILVGTWNFIKIIVSTGWNMLRAVFTAGVRVIMALWQFGWNTLVRVLRLIWTIISNVIRIAWNIIVGIFTFFINVVTGRWGRAWKALRTMFGQIWNSILAIAKAVWATMRGIFSGALNAIGKVFRGVWGGIKGFFVGWWDGTIKLARNAVNTIGRVLSNAWGGIRDVAKGAWEGIRKAVGTAWGGIKKTIGGPIKWVVDKVWNPFARAINGALHNIFHLGWSLPTPNTSSWPHWKTGGKVGYEGGGQIPGFGGGDIYPAWIRGRGPAMLEPGEAIIDKNRTRQYSGLLSLMGVPGFANGGKVPGYALGGLIPDPLARFLKAIPGVGQFLQFADLIQSILPSGVRNAINAIVQLPKILLGIPGAGKFKELPKAAMQKLLSGGIEWIKKKVIALFAPVTTGAGSMLSFMLSMIGHPYSQTKGRFGPTYFDCSGLIWTAARLAGIPIPSNVNVAHTEANWFGSRPGSQIIRNQKNLQRADLVFSHGYIAYPSRYGPIGHVGMALSNKQQVSALGTAFGVRKSAINHFIVGIRLFGGTGINVGDKRSWAVSILRGMGIPASAGAVNALTHWATMEGGHWNNNARFNPLNTSKGMPGSRRINGAGVQAYNSWAQGNAATIATLRLPAYRAIVSALRRGDYGGVGRALLRSPWGTTHWQGGGLIPVIPFDSGFNVLPTGYSIAYNGTGRREPLSAKGAGNTYVLNLNVEGHVLSTKQELGRTVSDAMQYFADHGGKLPTSRH